MKLRKQISEEFKWDIGLFKTEEEINKAFKDLEFLTNEVTKYNGKFTDKEMFFNYFLNHKEKSLNIGKLSFYVGNMLNTDNSDVEMLKLYQRLEAAYSKYEKASSFVEPQLNNLDEAYLNELLLDPRSKDLKNKIKEILINHIKLMKQRQKF